MTTHRIFLKGINHTVECDESTFTPTINNGFWELGARTKFANFYADAKDVPTRRKQFDEGYAELLAGNWEARGTDPVSVVANEIARKVARNELGPYKVDDKTFVSRWKARVAEVAAKPSVIELATKQVAELAALAL
jgi:hypothetical protein